MLLALSGRADAAPTNPPLDADSSPIAEDSVENPGRETLDTIEIVPAPPVRPGALSGRTEYFYPYRRAFSPRVGIVYDTKAMQDRDRLLYLAGIQYLFQHQSRRWYEVGIDLVDDGTGYAQAARRWISSRNRYRPYAKAGGAVHLVPKEALATVLKLENWQVRGAIGFENLIAPPMSLRMEIELAVGMESVAALLTAGYAWGF